MMPEHRRRPARAGERATPGRSTGGASPLGPRTHGRRIRVRHEGPAQGRPAQAGDPARASSCRSSTAPRSACSAPTAPASPRCCASWPASTRTSSARRCRPTGLRIGYLPQEPQLDPGKDVRGNVEEGVAETRALLTRFEEVSAQARRAARRRRDGEAARRAGAAPGPDRRGQRLGPRPHGRDRDGRAARAARRRRRRQDSPAASGAGWRSAGCSRQARHAAARRAHQPPRRRVGGLARALPARSTRAPSSPITHDRYFLDNVAGWILELDRGHGIPWEGNYSSWLEQKQQRLAQEEKAEPARQRTLERELEWVRMAPRARRPRARRACRPTRRCSPSRRASAPRPLEIAIPPGPRLGDLVVEAEHLSARATATGC